MPTVVVFKDEKTFMAERVLGVYSPNDPDDEKLYFVAQVNGTRRRLDHEIVKNVYQLAPPDEEPIPPEVHDHVRLTQLELFPTVRGLLLPPLPAGDPRAVSVPLGGTLPPRPRVRAANLHDAALPFPADTADGGSGDGAIDFDDVV